MKARFIAIALASISLGAISLALASVSDSDERNNQEMVKRGKYIAQIAACNDCHTPGYIATGGDVPVSEWLTGNSVGFAGPWGVTYPKNLRILLAGMTEDEWVSTAKQLRAKPPMPWFILRDMDENDLRALYQFVRSLGVSGEPAPAHVPPGIAVNTPYIEFYPKNLPQSK